MLRKKHRDAEVSTDSLNDIMFFLLLFFLILSTMVSPNAIKVNLAKSATKTTLDKQEKPIQLAVTKDKKFFINNKEIQEANLENEIAAISSKMVEPIIFMHLDRDLPIQIIADIMTISAKLKCKPVLATAPNN
ncbi:MAG: biopolymer transporter ExbD [Bacteroidetes bacterium]|nr:biopolymer transporter ExbD [Bacteroidota bacterium]